MEKIDKLVDVISENYYQKKKVVFVTFLSLLSNENVLFYGIPGTGKTTLAIQIASAIDSIPTELVNDAMFRGGVTNPTTAFGAPNVKKLRDEGLYEYISRKSPFLKYGRIIDEINRMDPNTQNQFLSVLDETRKFTANSLPIKNANDAYIATANLNAIGTYPVSQQIIDRFGILIYLKSLSTSIMKRIGGKRAYLEDILESDKSITNDIVKKFKENGVTKELRREYSEIFGTLSPEEVKEIKEKASKIKIPEEYLLPIVASDSRLKYFNNKHYRDNIEYLKYIDNFSSGKRIEATLRNILPTYFVITGEEINEENVENVIFYLLPYILPKYLRISSEAEEYLRRKYNSGEIKSESYNTDEGKLFYISKLISNKLKEEYDRIKIPLKNTLTKIANGDDPSYDHPLIRDYMLDIKEDD